MKYIITYNEIPIVLTTESGKKFTVFGFSGSMRSDEEIEAIKKAEPPIRFVEYDLVLPVETKEEKSKEETKKSKRKRSSRKKTK